MTEETVHYRWLYREDTQIKVDADTNKEVERNSDKYDSASPLLASFYIDDSNNYVLKNKSTIDYLKTSIGLKEGDKFKFVHADYFKDKSGKMSFTESFVSWHVIFDGEKFIEDPDKNDPVFIDI